MEITTNTILLIGGAAAVIGGAYEILNPNSMLNQYLGSIGAGSSSSAQQPPVYAAAGMPGQTAN